MNFRKLLPNDLSRINSIMYSLNFAVCTKGNFDTVIARVLYDIETNSLFICYSACQVTK